MEDRTFQETVKKLCLFIYPPGYVPEDSEYSQEEQQSAKDYLNSSNNAIRTQQNPPPPSSAFAKIPPSSLLISHKSSSVYAPPPFISNLNPAEPIKCENWSSEQDKKLLQIVFQKNLTPNYAALYLKGRTPAACSRRFSRLKQDYTDAQWQKLTNRPKSLFKKNPKHWDLIQDSRLIQGIKQYGSQWDVIAKQVFNGERTSGAISDRFRILRRRSTYMQEVESSEEQEPETKKAPKKKKTKQND